MPKSWRKMSSLPMYFGRCGKDLLMSCVRVLLPEACHDDLEDLLLGALVGKPRTALKGVIQLSRRRQPDLRT
jgi:hypothetical protein